MLYKKGFMRTMYPYANAQYGKFELYSVMNRNENDYHYIITKIRILSHEIEKGFSLPQPRKGFGRQKLVELDHLLDLYEKRYMGKDDYSYYVAISVVNYYKCKAVEYDLDISFLESKRYDIGNPMFVGVNVVPQDVLCKYSYEECYDFIKTRHSVREFKDKELDFADIEKAILGAQMAPSACNRQSVKVLHINGKERCAKVLTIQNGAKGFSIVNDVFIVAADLSNYIIPIESTTAFVDCGLFSMSFLLSLHSLGIGSCPLLWNDESERAIELRKLVKIPENYEISLVIPAGYYKDKVKYAISTRKPFNMVYEKI